ncbi:putative FreB [Drepanopeziza brunnea f. sp. 'multigermtubi' MB_m1]|uniref:Putative FreB n=1 Tax=Marssonina brunnea f. sp. multigermtubi (strain MB_m1) TaxID=1072389 RepID=K1X3H1_MARBU|nr:putative FreB [Drepanopeziza brunnea f. sp. 'multigermtubi' MB_m1]EKD15248.1 putative FreB [Drepanopeziza brunnea f. sp. 'multigermtubi' MB_m1]
MSADNMLAERAAITASYTGPSVTIAPYATSFSGPMATIAPYASLLNGVDQTTNDRYKRISWFSIGMVGVIIVTIRIIQRFHAYIRLVSTMGRAVQAYWSTHTTPAFWKFKKYVLYAPLWNKRHNREFRLSSAMNMGTLPSRFHTILIVLYIASNVFYAFDITWEDPNKYRRAAEMRGRTGIIAVTNMIPLVIFAARNNPLISWLQISFDTYNLMHRWLGRIVVAASLIHTTCWVYVKHAATGWSGIFDQISVDPFAGWGAVGTVCMIVIFTTAFSPVRHAFYETFLDIHIVLAAVCMVATWIHCKLAKIPAVHYVTALATLWVCERIYRFVIIISVNRKQGWTHATVEALPGEACRVTMHLPKKVRINPGSHAYLRFAAINPLECHPFSVAWTEHNPNNLSLPVTEKKDDEVKLRDCDMATDVSFVIGAQSGFTRKLFNKASESSPRVLKLKAVLEGPYGGHHSLDSYGHCVLFAGATGITHQLSYVKHLIDGFHNETIATRKITLVWIVRDSEHLEWVRPWMDQILRLDGRRDCLQIKLYVTRPKNPREIISPSATVQMYPGRPNIKLIMEGEVKVQCGAMVVTVCGPGGLADNVREAVREVQEDGVVDFIEESFTW